MPATRQRRTGSLTLAAAERRGVVTGAPFEAELTRRVAGRRGVGLGGRTDLAKLAALLAAAEVVVVGNTGPAHLAAAVGTPVVSLFAPVVPAARWAPHGVAVELLGDQSAPCRGSRARECPVAGHPCLGSVAPGAVTAAVARLTASSGGGVGAVGHSDLSLPGPAAGPGTATTLAGGRR